MDDMAQYWSEYPLSEVDGQVPSALPVGRYVSVISNGHGALTAWVAGAKAGATGHRIRHPRTPPVRVTRGDPSREPEEVWFEPYTEEDPADGQRRTSTPTSRRPESGCNPRGYKWHVLVPESVRDGEELEYALREKNQYIEPAEVLRAIERSYESLVSQIPPTS